MARPVADRVLSPLARALALVAGGVLLALVAMICLSALGALSLKLARSDWLGALAPDLAAALLSSGIGPFKASFEIVEAALPPIVFSVLPLVQLRHAHARVDVFAERFSPAMRRGLDVLWHGLAALLIAVIAWRMAEGMTGKLRAGDTTFLLGLPIWWAYAACLPGAALAALIALAQGARALRGGRHV